MTFSKEDRAAWNDSEVMQELEKLADLMDPPTEAYQPVEVNPDSWEDENWSDEEKLVDAADELINPNSFEKEMRIAYNNRLIFKLEKIAEHLADKSNIKAAYRVETAIQKLRVLLREEK